MLIRVNSGILGRRQGDIVEPEDKDYSTFKVWAEQGDKRGGVVICVFTEKAPNDEDMDLRKATIMSLKEKNIKFFAGAKTEELLAKLKEAGE